MKDKKEIHFQVISALNHLDELQNNINNAISLSTGSSYLQDILSVAERNIGTIRLKLLVASDITE